MMGLDYSGRSHGRSGWHTEGHSYPICHQHSLAEARVDNPDDNRFSDQGMLKALTAILLVACRG